MEASYGGSSYGGSSRPVGGNWGHKPTFREKTHQFLREVRKESGRTLFGPIIVPIATMRCYKRVTAIFFLAIAVLAICSKYVNTQPMHSFNDAFSHSYKKIAAFLDNKTHATLVGCTGGVVYLLIGREFANYIKRNEEYSKGYDLGHNCGFRKGICQGGFQDPAYSSLRDVELDDNDSEVDEGDEED